MACLVACVWPSPHPPRPLLPLPPSLGVVQHLCTLPHQSCMLMLIRHASGCALWPNSDFRNKLYLVIRLPATHHGTSILFYFIECIFLNMSRNREVRGGRLKARARATAYRHMLQPGSAGRPQLKARTRAAAYRHMLQPGSAGRPRLKARARAGVLWGTGIFFTVKKCISNYLKWRCIHRQEKNPARNLPPKNGSKKKLSRQGN